MDVVAQQSRQTQSTAFGMDDEDGDVRRGRRPQPAQFAPEFPTRLVGKLHVGFSHRFQGFLMSGRQGSADFLFEIGHRAQRDRHAEDRLGNFLDAPFADALSAAQIRQCPGQTRAEAVSANRGGDSRLRDFAAASASAGMGLVLGDLRRDLRQLSGLKTLGCGIVRTGLARQVGVTMRTFVGDEMLGARHLLRRQQLFQMGRMIGLAAALALGFLLDDGLVSPQWICGRRHTRVGRIGFQPRFQLGQSSFQVGDASVSFAAAGAARSVHASMLQKLPMRSCASF